MINPFKSAHPLTEQHLMHCSGKNSGKSPISWTDQRSASAAQKHPKSNAVNALFNGAISSISLATLGVLASPFIDSSARDSILGETMVVCRSAAGNTAYLVNKLNEIGDLLNPSVQMTRMDRLFSPVILGARLAQACAINEKGVGTNIGRLVNYAGHLTYNACENKLALVGCTALLAAGLAWRSNRQAELREIKTEVLLTNKLQKRFTDAAEQLENMATLPNKLTEVKELAAGILGNKVQIRQELEALELPNLDADAINTLITPLIDSATRLTTS